MTISSIKEIDFSKETEIEMEGSILSISFEGNKEKCWPFKFFIKIEESGENIELTCWDYVLIDEIRAGISTLDIYNFVARSTSYKGKDQIILKSFKKLDKVSSKKVLFTQASEDELKKEIEEIIKNNISDEILKNLLEDLILKDSNFFQWPAATFIHHNYCGGLAQHSLNVCKNAMQICDIYKNENINREMIIAGSLLHDIGKLEEYNKDGSRTIYGNLISHIVSGSEKIVKWALKNSINPMSDMNFIILRHIILSHHEKLEFGSPVVPSTIEALIVSQADNLDSKIETCEVALRNLNEGIMSEKIFSLNTSMVKWEE